MSEVSNRRFVHFSGTKEEFKSSDYPSIYNDSIVFIDEDGGHDVNKTIYTHGKYYGQGVIVRDNDSEMNSAVIADSSSKAGSFSTAFGYDCVASGMYSHASGYLVTTFGDNSHAYGSNMLLTGENSFALGQYNTINSDSNYVFGSYNTIYEKGSYSVSIGIGNNLFENSPSIGQHAYAIGFSNTIDSSFAVTIGNSNTTSAQNAYTFGEYNVSNGVVIGKNNNVYNHAYVFGGFNYSSHYNSFLLGHHLYSTNNDCVILGKYNADSSCMFAIGCGTSNSNKKNAIEVKSDGIYQLIDGVLAKLTETTTSEIDTFSVIDNKIDDIFDVSIAY